MSEPLLRKPSNSGNAYGAVENGTRNDWPPTRSRMRLLGLNAFVFAYGILIATFGLITLPMESERMAPQAQAVILAVCV